MAPHDTWGPTERASLPRTGVAPSACGHGTCVLGMFSRKSALAQAVLPLARMLQLSEEAAMRHRTGTVSLLLLLFLCSSEGSSAPPLVQEAAADVDRGDWAAWIAEMDQALARAT